MIILCNWISVIQHFNTDTIWFWHITMYFFFIPHKFCFTVWFCLFFNSEILWFWYSLILTHIDFDTLWFWHTVILTHIDIDTLFDFDTLFLPNKLPCQTFSDSQSNHSSKFRIKWRPRSCNIYVCFSHAKYPFCLTAIKGFFHYFLVTSFFENSVHYIQARVKNIDTWGHLKVNCGRLPGYKRKANKTWSERSKLFHPLVSLWGTV